MMKLCIRTRNIFVSSGDRQHCSKQMAPEPVCLSLVLLVTIQGVLCIRHESQGDTQNRLNNRIAFPEIKFRKDYKIVTKRSIGSIRNSVITGIKALKFLLSGTIQVSQDFDVHKKYIKSCGISQMNRDFKALINDGGKTLKSPVREWRSMGQVGNLSLFAKSKNEHGYPSITVYKTNELMEGVYGKRKKKIFELPRNEIIYKS